MHLEFEEHYAAIKPMKENLEEMGAALCHRQLKRGNRRAGHQNAAK